MKWLVLLFVPALALGHGGTPQINQIQFPPQLGQRPLALTDNQGFFARVDAGAYRWLCEDAVRPSVDMLNVALLGDGLRVLVGTLDGLLASDDGGCEWAPVEGSLGESLTVGLWPHPTRREEVLAITARFGGEDDVYRSVDGGREWRGAGLALDGPSRGLLRASADPERVFLASGNGAFRSDDGGASFAPIANGPPELDVQPGELEFIASSPVDADLVFAGVERFPDTLVLRSADGGKSWTEVDAIPDVPKSLVLDCEGREGLIVSPFDGFRRSDDGGRTWTPAETTVELVGVVAREPETERLWSSTNVFSGGPWVLAYSDDFGRSWTPHFQAYPDVDAFWACPAESTTARECADLCPGLPLGAECAPPTTTGLHAEPPPARRCDGVESDTDVEPDTGVEPEVGGAPDAGTGPARASDGCSASGAPAAWPLGLLPLALRRRRSSAAR